eukprot:IDg16239t1
MLTQRVAFELSAVALAMYPLEKPREDASVVSLVNRVRAGDIARHGAPAFTYTHNMHRDRPLRRRASVRGDRESSIPSAHAVLEEDDAIQAIKEPVSITDRHDVRINQQNETESGDVQTVTVSRAEDLRVERNVRRARRRGVAKTRREKSSIWTSLAAIGVDSTDKFR